MHHAFEQPNTAASHVAQPDELPIRRIQSWMILAMLYAIFCGVLVWSAAALPPRMASHFDAAGHPNGWMSRDAYLWTMGLTGALLPLFLMAMAWLMRVLPSQLVNLPHRDYWLAEERKAETTAYIGRTMQWLACFTLMLFTALHWLVVDANRQHPVQLSNGAWVLLGAFLLTVFGWSVNLLLHFSQPPMNKPRQLPSKCLPLPLGEAGAREGRGERS